jgi:hypothetical protein
MAAAEQNYGQVAARIRRPFDFAARTGKIVFDATLQPSGLLGWVALDITEDPIGAPSYLRVQNEENGPVPRNALEIHFDQNCQVDDQVSVNYIIVTTNYTHHIIEVSNEQRHCVAMKPGQLNHVEVDVSSQHVAIYASPHRRSTATTTRSTRTWHGSTTWASTGRSSRSRSRPRCRTR